MTAPGHNDVVAGRSQEARAARARSAPREEWPEERLGERAWLSVGEFALFALRIALGLSMLQVAYKLFRGGWDGWTSASALLPGVVQGPLGNVYTALWGNQIVLWLMILGSFAVGVALVFGLLTRLGALLGTFMMLSFYTANLPPSSGWFDVQLVQMFAFFVVASMRAGNVWGVDHFLRPFERKQRWLYWVLG